MMEEEKLQTDTPTNAEVGATQPVVHPVESQEDVTTVSAASDVSQPDEDAARASAEGTPAQTPPKPKPESKMRRLLRRLFRWILGILIIFGLGFVTASWLLYRPARHAAEKAQAAAEAASRQAEVAQGQLLEVQAQVKDLQHQLQQAQEAAQAAQLKEVMAEAYANAYALRLALKDDDATGAHLHAEALAKALDALKNLVPPEHQAVVVDLQKQIADVQAKLDSPNYADRQVRNIIHNLTTLKDLLDH